MTSPLITTLSLPLGWSLPPVPPTVVAQWEGLLARVDLALGVRVPRGAALAVAGVAAAAVVVGLVTRARRGSRRAAPSPTTGASSAAELLQRSATLHEKQLLGDLVPRDGLGVSFDDIGGLDSVIAELEEAIILPLARPDLYAHSAVAQHPTGVLLYGPPGTGKTLLAKALAANSNAAFLAVDVAKIQNKYYGETTKLVSAVFSLAEKVSPCVVFLDEVDGLLAARADGDAAHVNSMKAKFLDCWDGLRSASASAAAPGTPHRWVLVIGATNKPWALDPAVLRRMPRQVYVGLPAAPGRASILRVLLRGERVAAGLDVDAVAGATEGFSGSDLKELVRAAALVPIREAIAAERVAGRAARGGGGSSAGGGAGAPAAVAPRGLDTRDLLAALAVVKPTGVAAAAYLQAQAGGATSFRGPRSGGGSAAGRAGGGSTSDRGALGALASPPRGGGSAPIYAPSASMRLNSLQLSGAMEAPGGGAPPSANKLLRGAAAAVAAAAAAASGSGMSAVAPLPPTPASGLGL